jgi:hypothetical protein
MVGRAGAAKIEEPHAEESTQVGFDTRFTVVDMNSEGLRPLHRALLPSCMEAWHVHALPLALFWDGSSDSEESEEKDRPLLRGPLAQGVGSAEWMKGLDDARLALRPTPRGDGPSA